MGKIKAAGNRGIREWMIQRITAIYTAIYAIAMLVFIACHPQLQYSEWQNLFGLGWVKVLTIVFLIGLIWHAWLGLWTVITDYLHVVWIRLLVQLIVILVLFISLVWGVLVILAVPTASGLL